MVINFKSTLLKFLILTGGTAVANLSYAQCSGSGDPVSITGTNCPNVVIDANKTDVTIQAGAYVGTTFGSANPALSLQGATVGSLNNYGVIQGQSQNTSGIEISGNSVLTNLNNTSTINGALYAIKLVDSGSVSRVYNTGNIFNNGNTAPAQGIFLATSSGSTSIATIDNLGSISGSNGAIYLDTANGASTATIDTINNSGSINGGQDAGILVGTGDSIRVINNTAGGEIRTGACNGLTCYNSIRNWGTISEINNNGTILGSSGFGHIGYGIENNGQITTLNNAQNNLTYTGSLPINYNVIIAPSTYGKMAVSGSNTSVTNFGIYPGATFGIGSNTYTSVLSGIDISSVNSSTQSGTYGGGLFRTNWSLSANANNANQLDLTANTQALTPNTNTASGNNLGAAVIAGASASSGTTTILASGTTLAAAAQSLTAAQANQLSNVHAEGYSSNMTIGLEQMAHITNTVMDRIHNPLSNRAGTSTAYEMDQGKYLWFDAAAVKGSVNSYDGLAGFGYNLYDAVIGGDIMRDSSGGLGLYAGAGYTTMTEPAQVSQNFNTTNYYAGLYGGKYLPYNFKLSGALGYMYGETNASRNNPNVGLFTGGTANSNYGTNGVYGAFKFSRPFQASESLTLTPYVGASYSQLWMGQANESGGGDFSYNISNATAYTTVTFVGGEFIMPLTGAVKNPMSLVGFYRFGYDWFANSAYAHSITANSSKFGSFNQVGADMGPALNLGGLGVQGNITKSLSGRIGVVGSANTNGWQVGGGGELKWAL